MAYFCYRSQSMANITLLSDMGLQDASVAVVRGILMQQCPGMSIADITHDVTPFNTQQAAYLLASAYRSFPRGTFHLVLFDLFPPRLPALTVSEHGEHYFLSADNGVVPAAIGSPPARCWQTTGAGVNSLGSWANTAAQLINQLQRNNAAGLLPYTLQKNDTGNKDAAKTDGIPCDVIHIDRYENVVISLTREQFELAGAPRQFRLQFMQTEEINEVSTSYADVRPGFKLARFNSSGHMEICINRGRAASLFGLRLGARNNDIKMIFE